MLVQVIPTNQWLTAENLRIACHVKIINQSKLPPSPSCWKFNYSKVHVVILAKSLSTTCSPCQKWHAYSESQQYHFGYEIFYASDQHMLLLQHEYHCLWHELLQHPVMVTNMVRNIRVQIEGMHRETLNPHFHYLNETFVSDVSLWPPVWCHKLLTVLACVRANGLQVFLTVWQQLSSTVISNDQLQPNLLGNHLLGNDSVHSGCLETLGKSICNIPLTWSCPPRWRAEGDWLVLPYWSQQWLALDLHKVQGGLSHAWGSRKQGELKLIWVPAYINLHQQYL